MRFQCSHCSGIVEVDDSAAGQPVSCCHCQQVAVVPADRFSPGAVIGDFAIQEALGHGGVGMVYRAQQISLGRVAAIKIIDPKLVRDPLYVEEFLRDAQAASQISHPNLAEIYEAGEDGGIYYFGMEFVQGTTLKHILAHSGRIVVDRALEIATEVSRALDCAWRQQQLPHRDIKPENILLTESGQVKLLDLGLPRPAFNPSNLESEESLGDPHFLPPEALLRKRLDNRSDIYGLGVTLYQAVTGRFPYQGASPAETAQLHLSQKLVPPRKVEDDVPESVSRLIEIMLAKRPEHRYQDAAELTDDLELVRRKQMPRRAAGMSLQNTVKMTTPMVVHGRIIPPPKPAAGSGKSGGVPKKALLIGGIAAGVLLVAGVVLALVLGGRKTPAPGKPGTVPSGTAAIATATTGTGAAATATTAAAAPAPAAKPVAFWPFEESSGRIASDRSPDLHHSALRGGIDHVGGRTGGAIRFNKKDAYVLVPAFDYTTQGAFSLGFWLKIAPADAGGTGERTLFSHGKSGKPGSLSISYVETGNPRAPGMLRTALRDARDDGSSQTADALNVAGLADGNWHHYMLVADAKQARVYVDGAPAATAPRAGGGFKPETDIYLGAREDLAAPSFFGGSLDEVRLFNHPLSEAAVIKEVAAAAPTTSTADAPKFTVTGNGTGLKADYYADKELKSLRLTRTDPNVFWSWKDLAPAAELPTGFSVRWTGQLQPRTSGLCQLAVETHGKIRLWIDGKLVLDKWKGGTYELSTALDLKADRRYDICLDYAKDYSPAYIRLLWGAPGQTQEAIPQQYLYPAYDGTVPALPSGASTETAATPATPAVTGNGTGLKADYFSAGDFKKVAMTRTDPTLFWSWSDKSPAPEIPANSFSVRWAGQVQPAVSGAYRFSVVTQGSFRLWLDGKLVLDKWSAGVHDVTASVDMTADRRYDVCLDYAKGGNPAYVKLMWAAPGQSRENIPQSQLYPDYRGSLPAFPAAAPAGAKPPENTTKVAAPVLNPPAGMFAGTVNITVSCATGGATFKYAKGGKDPEKEGAAVSGNSINLDASTILKVKAYKSGSPASDIVTGTYVIGAPAKLQIAAASTTGAKADLANSHNGKIDNRGSYKCFTLKNGQSATYEISSTGYYLFQLKVARPGADPKNIKVEARSGSGDKEKWSVMAESLKLAGKPGEFGLYPFAKSPADVSAVRITALADGVQLDEIQFEGIAAPASK